MSSSVFDFKAINARCREMSRETFGQGSRCKMCVGHGWVMGPDPRKGFPGKGYECPSCHNPLGLPDPFFTMVENTQCVERDDDPFVTQAPDRMTTPGNIPSQTKKRPF